MLLKKGQLLILLLNMAAIIFFTIYFIGKENYEFLLYIGVIIFFLVLILATNKKVNYPNTILWGLTIWALLHMAGGALYFNGIRLYEIILIPLSQTYQIFRYDQFVHMVGFGVATFVMYSLIQNKIGRNKGYVSIGIVIVMAGLGMGALNEIIEFLATVITPETGVGGYLNTSLDLVSNLIGAVIAWIIIYLKHGKI